MISVGIDIGSSSVKVARVEGSTKGFKVISLEEYPLTTDPTKDTTLDIIEILKDASSRHGANGEPIVLAAKQDHCTMRLKSFPFRERHKILKSLPFELEDEIPLPIDQSILDIKVTHYQGNQTHFLALAVLKDHVNKIVTRANDSGFSPAILSVEGLALSNLFDGWPESPPEIPASTEDSSLVKPADVILHMGHKTTIVTIMVDRRPLQSFSIDWGGKEIAESIAKQYNMQYVEAIKELKSKGFVLTTNEGAARDQVAFSDTIKAAIEPMSVRVRLALTEAEANHNIKVRQVHLTGGVSLLRNLAPFLTQKLEIICNRLTQLENHPECDLVQNPHNDLSQLVAIGLACEALKRPKNPPINLLKGEYLKTKGGLAYHWANWKQVATPIIGLFAIFTIWAFLRDGAATDLLAAGDQKVRNMGREIIGLKGAQLSLRNIKNYIRDQETKLKQQELLNSLEGISSSLDVLKNISALAPGKTAGKINVQKLIIRPDRVEISGQADKNEVIESYRKGLQSLAKDKRVSLLSDGQAIKAGYKPFNLKFALPPKSGEVKK